MFLIIVILTIVTELTILLMLRLSSLQCESNTCAVVRASSSATASLTGCRHHHHNHQSHRSHYKHQYHNRCNGPVFQLPHSALLHWFDDSIGRHSFKETVEFTSTIIGFIHRHSFNEAVEYRNLIAKVRASEEVPVILVANKVR